MAIAGITDNRQGTPLAGKIKLGKLDEKKGRPIACEYFVVPPEVQAAISPYTGEPYGEQPECLDILLLEDELEKVFPHYLRKYQPSQGIVCKGDGERAQRFDMETRKWREVECRFQECPEYKEHRCKPFGRLTFLLPATESTGVWALDITSLNSIKALLSDLRYVQRQTGGKLRGVPLQLYREPRKVQVDSHQYTYHIVRLRYVGEFESALRRLCGLEAEEAQNYQPAEHEVAGLAEGPRPEAEDVEELLALLQRANYEPEKVQELLQYRYGVKSFRQLAGPQVEDFCSYLKSELEGNERQLAAYISGAFKGDKHPLAASA